MEGDIGFTKHETSILLPAMQMALHRHTPKKKTNVIKLNDCKKITFFTVKLLCPNKNGVVVVGQMEWRATLIFLTFSTNYLTLHLHLSYTCELFPSLYFLSLTCSSLSHTNLSFLSFLPFIITPHTHIYIYILTSDS